MFQTFEDRSETAEGPGRLARLRAQLANAGLDGFAIPRSDAHQGETVAACDERLAWLTGFTGSAGLCLVLPERAAVIVDGRYTLQAASQCDAGAYEIVPSADTPAGAWLTGAASRGQRIGYDPMLHSDDWVRAMSDAAAKAGAELTPMPANPVDAIWNDRPAPPRAPARAHPEALAGETAESKRLRMGAAVAEAGAEVAALTLPESLAWLLNIRGDDIARTPVVHAFALLEADGAVRLFTDPDKFAPHLRDRLGAAVTVEPAEAFMPALDGLGGRAALVDGTSAPSAVRARLEAAGATLIAAPDPCIAAKAVKTEAELAGARAAHLRDGAALAELLAWLDETAPSGALTEIDVVSKLEAARAATGGLRDISFETICGAGPNGAIVHYRVNRATNRAIAPGDLVLIDSGGQYEDGTTDVTRTIAIGPAGAEERRCATLVLKGMIAISRARFPKGISGRDLDPLARIALWREGLDFAHGVGHGVGAYLGVHEGPYGISRRSTGALPAGVILSNEPGCYVEGRFGIRIENLIVTRMEPGAEETAAPMGFETLTLAPIDRRLIDASLMDAGEIDWLDAYHARVAAEIGPRVTPATRRWLEAATAPLERP